MTRLLDIVCALIGLILLAVILPVVSLAIWLDSGGPVFFSQVRYGLRREPFTLYKFRTMRGEQVTRVGRILRRTHLDELPQVVNVLRGEMAIVGPRPEKPEIHAQLAEQVPGWERRLSVKPGITGVAQVLAENVGVRADDSVKLFWDLWYIERRSFWVDLLTVGMTAGVMVKCNGV